IGLDVYGPLPILGMDVCKRPETPDIVAVAVGVASVAVGIGIPFFYETQIDSAAKRENTQPCFPCTGTGAQKCRFCMGNGSVTVDLGGEEKEVSKCINCDGLGSLTCTTCQGSGIQPRYLDRRQSFVSGSSFSNVSSGIQDPILGLPDILNVLVQLN
ncbi:hypothetical protein KSS87_004242, partial [Heliosperma pusillum]